ILAGMNSVAFAGLLSAVAAKSPGLFTGQLGFLLFEPSFHLWEQQHPLQGESHQMIRWVGHGPGDLQMAREWHEMPHRKTGIPALGLSIYLSTPGMTERFEQAKARWRSTREEALAEGAQGFADHLDCMLALYDRTNWEEVVGEGGERGLRYLLPNELKERFAPLAEEAERNLGTLAFPLRCRQILDGDCSLGDDQLEAFWTA